VRHGGYRSQISAVAGNKIPFGKQILGQGKLVVNDYFTLRYNINSELNLRALWTIRV
jgi:hypothetical protein